MILPAKTGCEPVELTPDPRQIVIVGANGAGKSRFAAELSDMLGEQAYRLNVLKALYDQRLNDASPHGLDALYEQTFPAGARQYSHGTQLERLLALLMHDEMVNLFNYKARAARQRIDSPDLDPEPLQRTRLDHVIELWQEVFPDNRILTENGEILFASAGNDAGYSPVRLSAGEKAVIYYIGAVLYAPSRSAVLIEAPELFLHPSLLQSLWNRIELLRDDCTFIYTTHDLEFASSRSEAVMVWVQSYDATLHTWQYEVLPPGSRLADEMYLSIIGSRKPVLFIEGDATHSIDAKLYPLIFKDYAVQSLGSCNKVIEATRTFNDLTGYHHLDSQGIVDRDRRDDREVAYLRRKRVMVPDVAEIENILMLEEVIRTVASRYHKNEDHVFASVSRAVFGLFGQELRRQALQHTRHRIKRTIEYRIDGRFNNITMFERHIDELLSEVNPRELYESLCREFSVYLQRQDYMAVLRVFNEKTMIPVSNVAALCGLRSKDDYVKAVLTILREDGRDAARIRRAVIACFGLEQSTEGAVTETVEKVAPCEPAPERRQKNTDSNNVKQRNRKQKRARRARRFRS